MQDSLALKKSGSRTPRLDERLERHNAKSMATSRLRQRFGEFPQQVAGVAFDLLKDIYGHTLLEISGALHADGDDHGGEGSTDFLGTCGYNVCAHLEDKGVLGGKQVILYAFDLNPFVKPLNLGFSHDFSFAKLIAPSVMSFVMNRPRPLAETSPPCSSVESKSWNSTS
jgi:hypothetical protein